MRASDPARAVSNLSLRPRMWRLAVTDETVTALVALANLGWPRGVDDDFLGLAGGEDR